MAVENLANLYGRARHATRALNAQAAEVHDLTKRLEKLMEGTPAWNAGTKAKVEARAALEQAEELKRVLEELGKRLGE